MESKPGKGESKDTEGVMDSKKRVGSMDRDPTGVRELLKLVYQREWAGKWASRSQRIGRIPVMEILDGVWL